MINSVTGAVFSHTIKVINVKSPVLSILKRWTNVCCPLTISVRLISYILVFHIPLFGFTFSLKYCCCYFGKVCTKLIFPQLKLVEKEWNNCPFDDFTKKYPARIQKYNITLDFFCNTSSSHLMLDVGDPKVATNFDL